MGLKDILRRTPDLDVDTLKRLGNLEGRFEGLQLQWVTYRDELRKLAQRLEKRDQRAATTTQREEPPDQVEPETPTYADEVDQRVRRRRAGGMPHAVPIRRR